MKKYPILNLSNLYNIENIEYFNCKSLSNKGSNSILKCNLVLNDSELKFEHVYLLSKSYDNINVYSQTSEFTPSVLRNFSAPVILKTDLTNDDYLKILKFDSDGFNRWDAIQNLFLDSYLDKNTLSSIIPVLKDLLSKKSLNASLLSHLFDIPSRNTFENFTPCFLGKSGIPYASGPGV